MKMSTSSLVCKLLWNYAQLEEKSAHATFSQNHHLFLAVDYSTFDLWDRKIHNGRPLRGWSCGPL